MAIVSLFVEVGSIRSIPLALIVMLIVRIVSIQHIAMYVNKMQLSLGQFVSLPVAFNHVPHVWEFNHIARHVSVVNIYTYLNA